MEYFTSDLWSEQAELSYQSVHYSYRNIQLYYTPEWTIFLPENQKAKITDLKAAIYRPEPDSHARLSHLFSPIRVHRDCYVSRFKLAAFASDRAVQRVYGALTVQLLEKLETG